MEKRHYERIPAASEIQLDQMAGEALTDYEYELEYQGLFIEDKRRFLINKLNSPVS
jgi:hypothetical protein